MFGPLLGKSGLTPPTNGLKVGSATPANRTSRATALVAVALASVDAGALPEVGAVGAVGGAALLVVEAGGTVGAAEEEGPPAPGAGAHAESKAAAPSSVPPPHMNARRV
jgi:hypothetical protein